MKLVRYTENIQDSEIDAFIQDELCSNDDMIKDADDLVMDEYFNEALKQRLSDFNAPRVGILMENEGFVFDIEKAYNIWAAVNEVESYPINTIIDALMMQEYYELSLEDLIDYTFDHNLTAECSSDLMDVSLLTPIEKPSAIYALGRNFPDHAKESGVDVPKEPVYFFKSPNCLIAHEENVIWKEGITRIDPEAEFAVIIAQQCSNIEEKFAMEVVAGYTIMNDITARDMQAEDLKVAHPWFRSKNLDTFCPMGPCLVTPDEIGYPINLDIEMRVNGEVRQKDNTKNMTFNVPQVISYLSKYHTLYPGDIILMGTPEGMKPVKIGDVMEAYVEKIGILRNGVQREK